MRNYVLPVVGTTEGTGSADAESQRIYPVRELILSLSAGLPATAANDARDAALIDRAYPSQDAEFTVKGAVYSTRSAGLGAGGSAVGGIMTERPKWWVRAGDVIRINDLVPDSVSTPRLDAVRTFFILDTEYNAIADSLTVQPDRPPSRLDVLLPRLGLLERNK